MTYFENTGIHTSVIHAIQASARRYGISRVILFGSRARGEQRPKSDIDIAISGGDKVRFSLDVEENAPTLLEFDIVDLDGPVSDELRDLIDRDGRVIYEKAI